MAKAFGFGGSGIVSAVKKASGGGANATKTAKALDTQQARVQKQDVASTDKQTSLLGSKKAARAYDGSGRPIRSKLG